MVDAVFEVRFTSSVAVSSILPGLLFAKIDTIPKQIEKLPVSDIPSQIRNMDVSLRFQPLLRLEWGNFFVPIGDSSLAVTCKMPYPGWTQFKEQILKIMQIVKTTQLIESIDRYSIKYSNIIGGNDLRENIRSIDMDIRVGTHTVSGEIFTLRVEIPRKEFLHLIQIAGHGRARLHTGETREGAVVEVDTICHHQSNNFREFINQLPARIEMLHSDAKHMFFECLTPDAIANLEPVYE